MGLAILAEAFDYVWRGNTLIANSLADKLYFPATGWNLGCGRRRVLYCAGSMAVLCSREQVEACTALYPVLWGVYVYVPGRYPVSDYEQVFFLGLS